MEKKVYWICKRPRHAFFYFSVQRKSLCNKDCSLHKTRANCQYLISIPSFTCMWFTRHACELLALRASCKLCGCLGKLLVLAVSQSHLCLEAGSQLDSLTYTKSLKVIFQDRPRFRHINGKLSPRPFELYRLKNNQNMHYSLIFQDIPRFSHINGKL